MPYQEHTPIKEITDLPVWYVVGDPDHKLFLTKIEAESRAMKLYPDTNNTHNKDYAAFVRYQNFINERSI